MSTQKREMIIEPESVKKFVQTDLNKRTIKRQKFALPSRLRHAPAGLKCVHYRGRDKKNTSTCQLSREGNKGRQRRAAGIVMAPRTIWGRYRAGRGGEGEQEKKCEPCQA